MTLTVEAVYQNGQLKLKEPVVLADGTPVRVTITPIDSARAPRQLGTLKGTVRYMAPDFDAPLEDFKEYME